MHNFPKARSLRSAFASQSVYVLSVTVVMRLALLGVQALIARLLGVTDFNFFITAGVIGALASVASDAGLTMTVIFAARGDGENARLILAWLQRQRLVMALVSWLAATGLVLVLHHGLSATDIAIAALVVGSYVVQAYSRYRRSPLIAEQRPVWEAQLEFFDKGLAIVGAVVPMFFTRSLLAVVAGQMIGTLAGYITARVAVKVRDSRPLSWDRSAMRYGLNLSIAVLATQLYARLDYLVLSQLASANRAAAYAATYNIILGLSLMPIALARVASSHMSSAGTPARAWRDYRGFSVLTGLVGGAFVAAIGPVLVRVVFHFDDPQLAPVCLILGIAFVFMSINSSIQVLAPRSGTERRYLGVVGAALIVNFVVCVALIPSTGMLGAAIATAATEVFVAIAWFLIPRRSGDRSELQPPVASVVDS